MSDAAPILLPSGKIDDHTLLEMLKAFESNGYNGDFFSQFHYRFFDNESRETLRHGRELLSKCEELAPAVYKKLHKGTPFYWLGRAAFLVYDYETAAFYIDAAVAEDVRHNATTSPAILFFFMDNKNPNQASLDVVKILRKKIDETIIEYNSRLASGSTPLNFADIQKVFPAARNLDWQRALENPGYSF